MYRILYHEKVITFDIPKLDSGTKRVIKKAIEAKLVSAPEVYGKPLRQTLAGYRKLRVGDHRIVFKIEKLVVYILIIQHRSSVYKVADSRKRN